MWYRWLLVLQAAAIDASIGRLVANASRTLHVSIHMIAEPWFVQNQSAGSQAVVSTTREKDCQTFSSACDKHLKAAAQPFLGSQSVAAATTV